jgi:NhaA family Na+:H+ antiporter
VSESKKGFTNFLQEFSIPLIVGVLAGLVCANLAADPTARAAAEAAGTEWHTWYENIIHYHVGGASIFGHDTTVHYLINDIFMVFFFGIAAKEITESVLPGGDLNPPSKAINPLLGTIGGVVGPVAVYLLMTKVLYSGPEATAVATGWGIPTATDIALAWLVARMVFGNKHPAVSFLLLLAVADDAIGLGIIAVAYPKAPPEIMQLMYWTIPGMLLAYGMRKKGVNHWLPYIAFAGTLSWIGLSKAHLHPALALVFIVPFIPGPTRDTGMFTEKDEADEEHDQEAAGHPVEEHHHHSPLHNFEHNLKLPVDFGLFFFGFANAGVEFSSMSNVTWIVLGSLILGKTAGIFLFSWVGTKMGFPLPKGMGLKHLFVAGIIAGLGLTVALFVAGEAFRGDLNVHMGPAKMGAVFSAVAALLAILAGKALKVKDGPA